jgi:hypothetical protein
VGARVQQSNAVRNLARYKVLPKLLQKRFGNVSRRARLRGNGHRAIITGGGKRDNTDVAGPAPLDGRGSPDPASGSKHMKLSALMPDKMPENDFSVSSNSSESDG